MFEHFAKWAATQPVAHVAQAENQGQQAGQQPKPAENLASGASVARVAHVAQENAEKRKASDVAAEYTAMAERGAAAYVRAASGEGWGAEDWRTYYGERAGIAEFDWGLSRAEAEARAFECCVSHWQNTVPPILADGNGCPVCNRPAGEQAVPVLGPGGGHMWLHSGCVERFNVLRRVEARRELEKMGIDAPKGWTP